MKTTLRLRATFTTLLLALAGAAALFSPASARAAGLSPELPKTAAEEEAVAAAVPAPLPLPLAAAPAGPVAVAVVPVTFTPGDVYAWTATSTGVYNITAGGTFSGAPFAVTTGYTGIYGQIAWKGDLTVMYLSDYNAQVVLAVTPAGAVSVFATGLSNPAGLVWTPAGQLLVTESGTAGRVKNITAGGNFSAAPSFATGLPSFTRNMVVTPTGRVLIGNETNTNIYDITAGGAITAANIVATTVGSYRSIAVDALGRVLAATTNGIFDITAGGAQAVPTRGTGGVVGLTRGPGGKLLTSTLGAGSTYPVVDITAGGAVATAPVFASGFPGVGIFTALATVPPLVVVNPPPTVTTVVASGFGLTSATLNGLVKGNGLATTYGFDWGVSPALDQATPMQSLGDVTTTQVVSAGLTGLALDKTYTFRAKATNAGGTTLGATLSFSTPPLTVDGQGRYHLPAGRTWNAQSSDFTVPGDLVVEGTLNGGGGHLVVLGTLTVLPTATVVPGKTAAFFVDGKLLPFMDTSMSTLETLATLGLAGQQPMAKLLDGGDGWFYGTTASGGKANNGLAFRVRRTGEAEVLGNFTGPDGIAPQSALVGAAATGIFGTTTAGGTGGNGTVFRVLPTGGIVKVVDFNGTNGRMPSGGLTFGTDGLLYGVASRGGTVDKGTLFRVTALGAIEKLADFTGPNGMRPQAALTLGSDGRFYGVTTYGGTGQTGVIFSYDKINGLLTLASLSGPVGTYPLGALLEAEPGVFYGTCYAGGANDLGTVFRLGGGEGQERPEFLGAAPELVASFTIAVGQGPIGPLARGADGNFYGTAYTSVGNYGAVFKVTDGGALTRVTSVIGSNGTGAHPGGGLLLGSDGAWYGVSQDGGTSAHGAVFRVLLTGVMENVVSFTDTVLPSGLMTGPADAQFYGTTQRGGATGLGSVFGFAPRTPPVTLASFAPGKGQEPQVGAGAVFGADGTTLYGTAAAGALGQGSVWKLPAGGALSALVSFTGANGSGPLGGLVASGDGGFFGTTALGTGSVFKVTPAGLLTPQGTFTNGASPQAALVPDGLGFFYGTTRAGGAAGLGTVSKMTPGSGVSVVASFAGANGAAPVAPLLRVTESVFTLTGEGKTSDAVRVANSSFAGTTSAGGANGLGSLFKVTPGGALTTLFSFTGTEGNQPRGALLGTGDGGFFGTAAGGGAFGKGTVWRFGALGTMQVIAHLTGDNDGAAPSTGLTQAADGYLYGTTDATIFRVPFATSVTTLAATGFTPVQTTLRGEIQPRGLATTATFEWGTTPALGSTLAAGNSASTSAVPVSATLALSGGTTYYYRVKATNAMGVKMGSVLKFKTPPLVASAGGYTLPAGVVWTLPGDYTFAGNLTVLGTLDTAGQSLTVLGKLTLNALLLNATGVISYLDRAGNLPPGAIRLLGDAAHDAADLDGDTLGNLMEFALGTNPTVFSPNALPVPAMVGGFLTLTYHTPVGIGGVQVIVEVSNNLTNWFTGPGFTAVTSDTIANGVRTVTVRDDQGGALQYMRLRVTR